ncbi:MAG TPA: cobalamin-binding protein [Armatimonadota bacterium]|nr:cobalamin-binding protein [Armatimonadota bacterium]
MLKKSLYPAVILLCLVVILPSGCKSRSSTPATSTQRPKSEAPQRIVSLVPSHTEILFSLGLGDKVVGVTRYCNYPPEAAKKPKIGDMNVDMEKIVALKPDLVLAHSYLNDNEIKRLKSYNIKTIATDPKTFADVTSDIRTIGNATGCIDRAEKLAASMEKTIESFKSQPRTDHQKRVLVVVQVNPLWVAGPETFIDEMISYLNGKNVAYDAESGFKQFSLEKAFARDPQLIVVTRKEDKVHFDTSAVWKKTSAVKDGKVVVIDPDLIFRPGPRLVKGLEQLAEAME